MHDRAFPLLLGTMMSLTCALLGHGSQGADTPKQTLTNDPRDGIRLDNGDVGITLWGPNHRPTLLLGKADLWDRRFYGHREKIITLADIKRAAMTGEGLAEIQAGGYSTYGAYDFPCPKPGGQLIIGLPDPPEGWNLQTRQGPAPGELTLTAERGQQRLELRVYVHGARNLIVMEGQAAGIDSFFVRLWRHRDTLKLGQVHITLGTERAKTYDYSRDPGNGPLDPPHSGADGRIGWITQAFPAEATFPQGFRYTAAVTVTGAKAKLESVEGQTGLGTPASSPYEGKGDQSQPTWYLWKRYQPINEAPGAATTLTLSDLRGSFQILATLVSTQDATDTVAAAKALLLQAAAEDPAQRYRAHVAATALPDYGWLTRKPHGYYGDIPGCTVDTSAHCYQDSSMWHADFHFNELNVTGYFGDGQAHRLEPYYQLVEHMLPLAQNNARTVYGCSGCMFTLVHYPIRSDLPVHSNVVWEQSVEITALILKPFWQHYLYTGDREFLRTRSYPLLREGARFYADYVTLGEDGAYHVFPTVSPENWGLTRNLDRNKDSQSALSLIKYHLTAAAQAARLLNVDPQERARWQLIAEKLAPYPTCDTPDGPIFTDVAGAPALSLQYNIAVPLAAVFWGDDISLDSPPETLAIARRTAEKIKAWQGYVDAARSRLGDVRGGTQVLLSYSGVIHLFPTVPDDYTGQFGPLRAVGAFEVSAACAGGVVRKVRIKSRAGNPCRLYSPWPEGEVKVLDLATRDPVPHTMEGRQIVFSTTKDHTYAVLAGAELALADMRFVPEDRLIGKWSFARQSGELVPDASGNGPPARLMGGATLAPGAGLRLEGREGAYAQVERVPAFDFGVNESFSVEARVLVPREVRVPMNPLVCSMATRQYCLTVADSRAKWYLSSPSGDVACSVSGKTDLADGAWHTVRGVRDAAEGMLRIFVDGKLEGMSPDLTTGDFTCTAPLTIGAYLWGQNSRFARALIGQVEIRSLGKLVPRDDREAPTPGRLLQWYQGMKLGGALE